RRSLGAADARELRVAFHAPALDEEALVGHEINASGPELVSEEQRERARHRRLLDAERDHGTERDLVVDLEPAQAAAAQLVRTELLVGMELEAEPVEPRSLERAHDQVPHAVALGVEEGVADRDR